MRLIASLLTISVLQVIFAEDLPSDFKKCNLQDSTCLADAMNDALPKLASGIKALGVPALDPLHMEKLSIASGKIVQLVQNYDKLDIFGLSAVKVSELGIDLDKGKISFNVTAPKLEIKGSYSVRGKILVLDVYGTGDFQIELDDVVAKFFMDIQKYEKNGETYIKVTKFRIDLVPGHVHFQFDNLFDGNKQLGDNINNVLNDNWKEIYDELKDGYLQAIANDLMKLSNKLFKKVPLKYIFLSS